MYPQFDRHFKIITLNKFSIFLYQNIQKSSFDPTISVNRFIFLKEGDTTKLKGCE
jgi:hypothetical protein